MAAGGAAATGSTGNAFVAWKKSKSIITYFTATAALARSLRLHRRRGRNGAAAPWPQVPTCQMDSPQHKQLRLFVLLMKRSPRSLGYVRENARQEPSPHHRQHCRGRKVSEPREGGYTRLQFSEDDQGPNFGRQQPRTRLSRRLACRP